MKPPYQKPPGKRRKRRPGAKPGHPGRDEALPNTSTTTRSIGPSVARIVAVVCSGANETRTRYTEDIPDIQPEVTEHVIHRDWCPKCRKQVEPAGSRRLARLDAGQPCAGAVGLAALRPGQHALADRGGLQLPLADEDHAPAGWCRCGIGCRPSSTPGTSRFSRQALHSAVLHADESGWRVDGKTHWLWSL